MFLPLSIRAVFNLNPSAAVIETTPSTRFAGTNVPDKFDLYRAGVHVTAEAVFVASGALRIDHASDLGNIDTAVYRTPDPTNKTQHWGRDPDSVVFPGPYAGPFNLPVLAAPP